MPICRRCCVIIVCRCNAWISCLRCWFYWLQVSSNPPWFLALVWGEVLLQLPFFFVATYAFVYRKKWIRIPALVRYSPSKLLNHKVQNIFLVYHESHVLFFFMINRLSPFKYEIRSMAFTRPPRLCQFWVRFSRMEIQHWQRSMRHTSLSLCYWLPRWPPHPTLFLARGNQLPNPSGLTRSNTRSGRL